MSFLLAIFYCIATARAEGCPNLQGNFLACSSSMAGDSEAKEFLIDQKDTYFTIDSVGRDGSLSRGREFIADASVIKSANGTVQSFCEDNALVQREALFLDGNLFLSFTAKYFLPDEEHLQMDIFLSAQDAKPAKSIRCIRFR